MRPRDRYGIGTGSVVVGQNDDAPHAPRYALPLLSVRLLPLESWVLLRPRSAPVIIGVPKEIKTREYRVGMTPAGARSLASRGHKVLVEKSAGEGSGIADAEYVAQGAQIVATAADAWGAEMVVKVKEPLKSEFGYF